MKWQITRSNGTTKVTLPDSAVEGSSFEVTVDGRGYKARWARSLSTLFLAPSDGSAPESAFRIRNAQAQSFAGESDTSIVLEYNAAGRFQAQNFVGRVALDVPAQAQRAANKVTGSTLVRSPMAGKVIQVLVENEALVKKGEGVVIIEAMKMENRIFAPQDGTIKKLQLKAGASVNAGDPLFEVDARP